MIRAQSICLKGHGVRLEPMEAGHVDALARAASDGRLWELWYAAVPSPDEIGPYIDAALAARAAGTMLPWVVVHGDTGEVIGSTRYHDIVPEIDRVEIGYTWYAAAWQGTHVNAACKLLLLEHAFDGLGCAVVGLRTDRFNIRSQRAIEAIGARLDGVLRHHQKRRDGSARDSVMYSILRAEWPDVRRNLLSRLARHGRAGGAGG